MNSGTNLQGGNTPLIVAARKGYNDIIDDLLTCENIDVNLANKVSINLQSMFIII